MKNLMKYSLLGALSLCTFLACEGPQGPAGFDGRDGFDGFDGVNATVYQIDPINFNAGNEYFFSDVLPANFQSTDALLVVRLREVDPDFGDIWEPLPQTYFLDEGTIQFTFDHSSTDFGLYLVADFNLDELVAPEYTDDQIFRFTVVSAEVAQANKNVLSDEILSSMSNNAKVIKLH